MEYQVEDSSNNDERWMREALHEAQLAYSAGEVPIGAVAVTETGLIARTHNLIETRNDATAHAEILLLQAAAQKLARRRLTDITVYVTIEPCPMCAMAMVLARIHRLVFGAEEPRTGAVTSFFPLLNHPSLNHRVIVQSGILAKETAELMKSFFRSRRAGFLHKNAISDLRLPGEVPKWS